MRLYNRTHHNKDTVREVSVQELRSVIRNYMCEGYHVIKDEVEDIIAWLPCITSVEVFVFHTNSYVKVYFMNGESVEFANIGIEEMLTEYADASSTEI